MKAPRPCPELLMLADAVLPHVCDRKAGHKGQHRERSYGNDGKRYNATMKWRRL